MIGSTKVSVGFIFKTLELDDCFENLVWPVESLQMLITKESSQSPRAAQSVCRVN